MRFANRARLCPGREEAGESEGQKEGEREGEIHAPCLGQPHGCPPEHVLFGQSLLVLSPLLACPAGRAFHAAGGDWNADAQRLRLILRNYMSQDDVYRSHKLRETSTVVVQQGLLGPARCMLCRPICLCYSTASEEIYARMQFVLPCGPASKALLTHILAV